MDGLEGQRESKEMEEAEDEGLFEDDQLSLILCKNVQRGKYLSTDVLWVSVQQIIEVKIKLCIF